MKSYSSKILFSESVDFELNIDHFINVLFRERSIKMSEYDEVHKRIVFSESLDFTAQYRYEH